MIANRREFLGLLAAGAAAWPDAAKAAGKNSRPNIVFFLVDDLGYGDLGCYGNKFADTPHIDRLARESMQFTNAYAGAPVCSPSRASIMTGEAPARLHLTQWIPGGKYPHKKLTEAANAPHLPADAVTLARQLKKVGYQTAAIGKWHLGDTGFLPEQFGFDVNVAGDMHGATPNYFGPFNFHNLQGYTKQDYLTEVLTAKMEGYIAEAAAAKEPFFLYMAEYSVHIPLMARAAAVEKYKKKNGGKDEPDPTYAAMIEATDTALGKLRAALEKAGVADNTILILTSDNGGVGFQNTSLHRIANNGGLRAGKGFLYEGGIREPLLVHWPGVTKPGSRCDAPVVGMDFMPTICGMANAGATGQVCDGVDFAPLLRGQKSLEREAIYWHYPHYSDQGGTPAGAMREGDWKLIEFYEDGHLELYNLALDPGEQYDFASTFSGRAEQMRRKLETWREGVNALMPKPNPEYNPMLAKVHAGPVGCSWDASAACKED